MAVHRMLELGRKVASFAALSLFMSCAAHAQADVRNEELRLQAVALAVLALGAARLAVVQVLLVFGAHEREGAEGGEPRHRDTGRYPSAHGRASVCLGRRGRSGRARRCGYGRSWFRFRLRAYLDETVLLGLAHHHVACQLGTVGE